MGLAPIFWKATLYYRWRQFTARVKARVRAHLVWHALRRRCHGMSEERFVAVADRYVSMGRHRQAMRGKAAYIKIVARIAEESERTGVSQHDLRAALEAVTGRDLGDISK